METVLFVDDEANILNSLKRGLIDEEYQCLFASSAAEALDLMEQQPVAVLCTDMRMPGMDGLTLLRIVKEKHPETVRVVLSGYTQLQQVLATINQADIFKFITKPWKMEGEFKVVIRQSLEYYRLRQIREELTKTLEQKNIAYQKILKRLDDVAADSKSGMLSMGEAGLSVVNFMESLVRNSLNQRDTMEDTSIVAEVFKYVVTAATMENRESNVSEMLEQQVVRLRGKKNVVQVEVTNHLPAKPVKVKPDILALVLRIVDELFMTEENRYYIKLIGTPVIQEGAETGAEFVVLMSQSLDDNRIAFLNNERTDARITLLNNTINSIVKCCGLSVSCARVESNLGMKFVLHYPGYGNTK